MNFQWTFTLGTLCRTKWFVRLTKWHESNLQAQNPLLLLLHSNEIFCILHLFLYHFSKIFCILETLHILELPFSLSKKKQKTSEYNSKKTTKLAFLRIGSHKIYSSCNTWVATVVFRYAFFQSRNIYFLMFLVKTQRAHILDSVVQVCLCGMSCHRWCTNNELGCVLAILFSKVDGSGFDSWVPFASYWFLIITS